MSVENLVRKNILQLKPYTSARESHLDGVLMDANENAFGSVVEFNSIPLNRYPDPNHGEVRNKLSQFLSVPAKNLFVGVGSDEIIDLSIRIFCEPGKDSAMILDPTYGMYKVACDINNVETVSVPLNDDFQIDEEEIRNKSKIKSKIKNKSMIPKLIFVCTPNNPTANLIKKESIIELAKSFSGIVVVDEAYMDFAEDESLIPEAALLPNMIVLRTFSKVWGLASVRCGYCVSSQEIINYFYKVKSPYNLNKLTSSVILSALDNVESMKNLRGKILDEREKMKNELNNIEKVKKVFPSDTNFILFRVDNPKEVYNILAERGIIIRDRSNQVEGALRVTVGTPEENQKFLTELKKILS